MQQIISDKQRLGSIGERLACQILEEKGYLLVAQNWRCRYGEVDIICYDSHLRILVFVEVKTRATPAYGGARHAISRQKYFRLRRLVGLWLEENADLPETLDYRQIRLDLIAIDYQQKIPQITHLQGI